MKRRTNLSLTLQVEAEESAVLKFSEEWGNPNPGKEGGRSR